MKHHVVPEDAGQANLGVDVIQFCPAVQYAGVCERLVRKQSIAWPWSESTRDKDRH
jgi:hypothetical protein